MTPRIFWNNAVVVFIETGKMLLQLGPYLLIGIVLGEVLKLTSWTKILFRILKKIPVWISVFTAIVLGIVSPLCTYGTVPVMLQLYKAGIPIAPLFSFLAASSLMNPQLFLLTWGGISPEIAIVRLVSVFSISLIVGFLLLLFPEKWIVNKGLQNLQKEEEEKTILNKSKKVILLVFFKGIWENLQFTGFYLIVGSFLGAIMQVFIPLNWFSSFFSANLILSVIFSAIAGIPLYACGGGTIPFIASMLKQGLNKGAVIAFFISGPATRITPLAALATIIRPVVIGFYIVIVLILSILIGLIYH